ncbi:MAG: 3-isopropylmalate dehydratase large subunit [Candidatus Stahlbacteria bacterium]|nr:3-isopropylmalate dehydratase large subunit [Candidatus Stahlbacteria bacterium]
MGNTITENILANHMDKQKVSPGEIIECQVDIVMANELSAVLAIEEFEKAGLNKVFDNHKIVLVPDHFTPNKDIKSAEVSKKVRDFAKMHNIVNYFEIGRGGIEHVLLPEQGLVLPGDLVIGGDSHTCTYGALGAFATGVGSTDIAAAFATGKVWLKVPEQMKCIFYGKLNKWVGGKDLILYLLGKIGVDGARYKTIEFTGETLKELTIADRFTIANMSIEAGAKNGIFVPDEITLEYVNQRVAAGPLTRRTLNQVIYTSDPDAHYSETIEVDVSQIEPQVSMPHLPSNTVPISQVGDIKIDQVVIGSCTNGRLEDLRIAAKILQDKKIHPEIRVIVIPGSQQVYLDALTEGLIEVFIRSGCVVSTPTCGPCVGGHMGVLASGEKCVATTNRNFIGRMGHATSEIYLTSPAIAAASAITGKISSPVDRH